MRLGDYLDKHGITQEAFARQIGVTQGRVSQLVLGGDLPSFKRALDLIERIEEATKGKVTRKDFLETA